MDILSARERTYKSNATRIDTARHEMSFAQFSWQIDYSKKHKVLSGHLLPDKKEQANVIVVVVFNIFHICEVFMK